MQTRELGHSGVRLSTVGLGGWELGGGRTWGSNESAKAVLAAAWSAFDSGVNWVDTAEVYGGGGGSETIVGRALAGRDDVLVGSKIAPRPDGSGFLPGQLKTGLARSLERLGRSHLDVCLLHWPDARVPVLETWGALAELVATGHVRAIGLSGFPPEAIAACHRMRRVDCVQLQLSLLYREERERIGAWCQANDVGIVAYGCLAFGILAAPNEVYRDWRSGTVAMDDFFVRENHLRFFAPSRRECASSAAARLATTAAEIGLTAAQLALVWAIHQPSVTSALAGTRSVQHARENAAAGAVELDEETLVKVATLVSDRADRACPGRVDGPQARPTPRGRGRRGDLPGGDRDSDER